MNVGCYLSCLIALERRRREGGVQTADCGNEESGSLVSRSSVAMHAVEGDSHIPFHRTEGFGITQTMDDNHVAVFITIHDACVRSGFKRRNGHHVD